MLISAIGSVVVLGDVLNGLRFDGAVYTWSLIGQTKLEIGFLIDPLSAMMMVVVTSVSLMVHIYTIGYMADDPGYQRFFSYISLFTFSMLMLVMSNNMVQLFFGWEAVGLVSYLLIGFWYTRPTAIFANMKAFLINRVGDFGFVLGIGLLFAYAGTMHYGEVFAQADKLAKLTLPGSDWMLHRGLHLPHRRHGQVGPGSAARLAADSMEGPTPISALIHAATMVTAGIFMVARFSPLFELSDVALSFIIVIGAIGALFLASWASSRTTSSAWSRTPPWRAMTVALGASAYSVAIFHLMTHAFFALLFPGRGLGHHRHASRPGHPQHGRPAHMPITWITFLLGTAVGAPFSASIRRNTSSKRGAARRLRVHATLIGVFVTSLYSFRLYFRPSTARNASTPAATVRPWPRRSWPRRPRPSWRHAA